MSRKKYLVVLGAAILALALVFPSVGCTPQATTTPTPTTPTPEPAPTSIELKAIMFVPPPVGQGPIYTKFLNELSEESNGEITIKIRGGPEVIGTLEQVGAVARGVVDIAPVADPLTVGVIPEAAVKALSQITLGEKLERGYYDTMQPYYNKAGLYFVADNWAANEPDSAFYTFTANKKIETLEDLKGLTFGGANPMYGTFIKEMGGELTVVPLTDAYTSLERGMVDGYIFPVDSAVMFGCTEVLGYCVDNPFYALGAGSWVVNLDKWNSLPPHIQTLMKDFTMKKQTEMANEYLAMREAARQKCIDAGMQFVKLPPADAEKYIDTIYDNSWEWTLKNISPDVGPQLRKLVSN